MLLSGMSAGEATTFGQTSAQSAALIEGASSCSCRAYVDIFTFGRWIAQGWSPIAKKGHRVGRTTLWCRCNVVPATRGQKGANGHEPPPLPTPPTAPAAPVIQTQAPTPSKAEQALTGWKAV